jgi:3-oxoacyl-[acyl-carrier protein] reductase
VHLGLVGKKALVTGGGKGIGRAIVYELEAEGCKVDIVSRTKGIILDVLKDNLHKIECKYDILINNVGGGGRWGSDNYEKFDEWDDVYKKNAGVTTSLTMKCIPYMRERKWGRVVTISSIFGKEGGGRPWFNMAKSAQISLMKSLGTTPHLIRNGITFNTVAPGYINVRGQDIVESEDYAIGRMGTPEEVSSLVVFLCSERASFITGSCFVVDGGESRSF